MWAIRVLTGDQAGKVYPLKTGPNTIGRAPSCDVVIPSPGISKQHAKIEIIENKILLTDLGSRNGTYVSGTQISTCSLLGGEKIGLNDIIIDLIPSHLAQSSHPHNPKHPIGHQSNAYPYDGNVAYQNSPDWNPQQDPHSQQMHPSAQASGTPQSSAIPEGLKGIAQIVKRYVEDVALPGVYKLTELLEFKWVLAIFMGAFIIFVTSLSSIPLVRILKTSIEKESQRRALTIARTLARVNRNAIMQGIESAISIEIGQREPGVDQALIISNIDGTIIAPARKAGRYPDLPFVHTVRKTGKEGVQQIDGDTIGAAVPIEFYNSKTGSQSTSAYAIVIYNMGSLAIDDSRTISLFVQTFFIALIVGSILFFFLYKIFEYPLKTLNTQIDQSLKEGSSGIKIDFMFEPLQKLASNIGSALTRVSLGDSMDHSAPIERDRGHESTNIVELIGFPALAINARDRTVGSINPAFEERSGINSSDLLHHEIETLSDQALKLSILDLLERVDTDPDQMCTNQLEISGVNYDLVAQAVYGLDKISYYLIVILPPNEGGYE